MNIPLENLYQQYKNTSIASFDGNSANNGQCVQWALMVRTKRDNLPVRYGNAIDWWLDRDNDPEDYEYIAYSVGVYPKEGDYVVWGAGVGSSAGHIDLCAKDGNQQGFVGYDSNWEDKPTLQTVQHNYSFGVLGYIRLKENIMERAYDDGDAVNIANAIGYPVETMRSKGDWNNAYYSSIQPYILQLREKIAQLQAPTVPTVLAAGVYQVK